VASVPTVMTQWSAFIRFHEKQPLISILSAFPVHPAPRRRKEFTAKGEGRIDGAGSSGTGVSFQIIYSNNKILRNVPILADSAKSRETETPFSAMVTVADSKIDSSAIDQSRQGLVSGSDSSAEPSTRARARWRNRSNREVITPSDTHGEIHTGRGQVRKLVPAGYFLPAASHILRFLRYLSSAAIGDS